MQFGQKYLTIGLLGILLLSLTFMGCTPKCPPEELLPTLEVRGTITNLIDATPVAGATVQAQDVNGTPVGAPATTDATGAYVLTLNEFFDENGYLMDVTFTLSVQSVACDAYPSEDRPPFPIRVLESAVLEDSGAGGKFNKQETEGEDECRGETWVIQSDQTSVKLIGEPIMEVHGRVLQLIDDAPIEGALVQALDINGAPLGTTGVTDAEGYYVLNVPEFFDENRELVDDVFTLRVQAQTYQEFPTPIRPSLPINITEAILQDNVVFPETQLPPKQAGEGEGEGELVISDTCRGQLYVIETPLTTVKLITLPEDTSILGSISGNIFAEQNKGLLIVAEGTNDAFTGFSDVNGIYTIFNVPAGSYTVNGYAVEVQLTPANTTIAESEHMTDVNLNENNKLLSSIAGNVQIVNAPGGSITSIVFAIESTFSDVDGRGKVPLGLRVPDVTGDFLLEGIPDGSYVVLAAFENDFLVRDIDLSIAGTDLVFQETPDPTQGNTITLQDSFKVTEALAVIQPGPELPEEVLTTAPMLEWADDSSEDGYIVWVLDNFGNELWRTELPGVSGSSTVSIEYGGPALEAGNYYQFRVISFRDRSGGRTAISQTEDLKGVFFYLGNS